MLITEKQKKYIEALVDQLGYKNSQFRKDYLQLTLKDSESKESASNVIEELLATLEIRKKSQRRKDLPEHTIVTDLSEFEFCPASFAIKKTFLIPKSSAEMDGTELHEQAYVEKFLTNLYLKRARDVSDKKVKNEDGFIYRGLYGDLLKSKIIFRGHQEQSSPFVSSRGNLKGIPDYIFKRPDNSYFVVEEKHSWQDEITNPWKSDIVQLLGYLYGIKEYRMEYGYLIYFTWYWHYGKLRTKNPRLFKVQKNETNKALVTSTFKKVNALKSNGKMKFNIGEIHPPKCYSCSAKVVCKHKAGKEEVLHFPYR